MVILSLQFTGLAKNATPEELSALRMLVATATVRREEVNQPAETSPHLQSACNLVRYKK